MPAPEQPGRRRSAQPRKGDLREQTILDVTATLLEVAGFETMTMGDIAREAGLSRGSMYFYFGSKQEVLVALATRTVEDLREKSRLVADEGASPREAVVTAMRRTEQIWLEHGLIMRVTIDQAAAIPELDALWGETAEIFIDAIRTLLDRAQGAGGNGGPDSADRARALCWMIERSFYHASRASPEALHDASVTCEDIWLRVAGLA